MVLTVGGWNLYKGDELLDTPRLNHYQGILTTHGTMRSRSFVTLQRTEVEHIDGAKGEHSVYLLPQTRTFAVVGPDFIARPLTTLATVIIDTEVPRIEGQSVIVGAVLEAVILEPKAAEVLDCQISLHGRVVGPAGQPWTAPGYVLKPYDGDEIIRQRERQFAAQQ